MHLVWLRIPNTTEASLSTHVVVVGNMRSNLLFLNIIKIQSVVARGACVEKDEAAPLGSCLLQGSWWQWSS
jgi:hypothetical protein